MREKKTLCLLLALLLLWQLTPMAMAAPEESGGAAEITGIDILRPAGKAVVSFHAGGQNALLILALYTPSLQMEDALTAEVSGGEGQAEFNFSRGFPEGEGQFHLHAMLVDPGSYAPLCPAYSDYSETLTPSVDDFEPDLVLNFDEQRDENFAVVAEGVTMLYAGQDFSGFTTEDEVNFTLHDVPSGTTNRLGAADRVVLFNGENSYPVSVARVESNGGTVTLYGKQPDEESGEGLNIADFFDYITLDQAMDQIPEDMEYAEGARPAEPEESVQLMEGLDITLPYLFESKLDISLNKVQLTGSASANTTFRIIFQLYKDEQKNPHWLYDISMENRLKLELSLKGVINNNTEEDDEYELPIAVSPKVRFPQAPWATLEVKVTIPFKIEIDGGVVVSPGEITTRWRMTGYDGNKPTVTQSTESSDPSIELEAGMLLDVGLCLKVTVEILEIFYIEAALQAGREFRAVMSSAYPGSSPSNGVWHLCDRCAKGADTVYIKTWIEIGGELGGKSDKKSKSLIPTFHFVLFHGEFNKPIVEDEFYVSYNGGGFTFGRGSCPNKAYLVDVKLKDTNNKNQVTGQISTSGGESEKYYRGDLYLPQGTYQISAGADGYQTGGASYEVKAPGAVGIPLQPVNSEGVHPGACEGWIGAKWHFTYSNGCLTVDESVDNFDHDRIINDVRSGRKLYATELSTFQSGKLVDGRYYTAVYHDRDLLGELCDPYYTLGTEEDNAAIYTSEISNIVFQVDFPNDMPLGVSCSTNLESVTFYGSVENIWENGSFADCPNLTVVQGLESTAGIGNNVFPRTGLRGINLPNSTGVWTESFRDCKNLTSVTLGGGTIGTRAFEGCTNLRSLDMGAVTEIRDHAFQDCVSLESVYLPDTLTKVQSEIFRNCTALTSVSLSSDIAWANSMFAGCSALRDVELRPGSNGVIGSCAFEDCTSLEQITIGDGTIQVGFHAFNNCLNLREVWIPGTVNNLTDCFTECPSLRDIYYEGTMDQWGAIQKYDDLFTYPVTIHCADGDVTA